MARAVSLATADQIPQYVADTHAIIWHMVSSNKLSVEAKRCFSAADHGKAVIYLSVMTPVELIYLHEKGRLSPDVYDQLQKMVTGKPDESYQIVDVSYRLARSMSHVPHEIIPDMPDRLIAATAFHLNLPLITKDEQIQQWQGIETIW